MDGNLSDSSIPVSENGGISCWETDIASMKDLNIGSIDILGHIEDKDLASKAVAFVVNSTRKGIVPLCADVATLFKDKKSLEAKISILRRENSILRSASNSLRTSHSASPTETSLKSYDWQPDQCNGKVSYSPSQTHSRVKRHVSSSSTDSIARSPTSQRSHDQVRVNSKKVYVDVHPIQTHSRKNSPPEITMEPNKGLPKISPKGKNASNVQCDTSSQNDTQLHEQFTETLQLNSKLAEELGAAKKEIEMLKARLQELEMNSLARQVTENYHLEDERHIDSKPANPSSSHLKPAINDHVVTKDKRTGYVRYIGHLDKIIDPHVIFVGLELDAPVGSHNGTVEGKEYFSCPANHGSFVSVHDIICVISKKSSKPTVPRRNSSDKKKSSKAEKNNNTIPGKKHASRESPPITALV